ncbi:PREDICTED: uncharacterized protein LOC108773223 [Cyphomyrmex costatus]|uniref:uncharacterized protein LOC108773223 n=1 Tax=Cyphomyrmex costatus TaxID=456900 RepID=UPI00085242A3|nr:PREDICTED: uncharacterized protein LOC108773223 [Cyphomyrmex costatus]
MASTSKNSGALIILAQICMVMLMFCVVESVTVSCLSYGHSCWGAHGKRGNIQDIPTRRTLTVKSLLNEFPQDNIAPFSKMQWILSRLITKQPILSLMDKYHIKGDSFPKDVPSKWNHNMIPLTDESVESTRIPFNNKNEDNEEKNNNIQGTMHNKNEKLENSPEILLTSSDEYDKSNNDPQKIDILKFLN